MIIGVPKEIKNHQYTVGMIPASVRKRVQNGQDVIIKKNAGMGISLSLKEEESSISINKFNTVGRNSKQNFISSLRLSIPVIC